MGTMPDHIVKPPFLKKLDDAANAYLATGLPDADTVVGDLQTMDLVDIGIKYKWVSTVAAPGQMTEEQHLRRHWFNNPPGSGWWPQIAQIEEILRQGFISVVNLVKTVNKPIDGYWLCHGPQDSGFCAVDAAVSRQQITVLVVTPFPPQFPTPQPVADLSIWTTFYDATEGQVASRPIQHVIGDFYPPDTEGLAKSGSAKARPTKARREKK
jgi:hypothetical protein